MVICGGGVAAIEGLLRLRALARGSVQVTLVAPKDTFVYRPLLVTEAVGFGAAGRYPLADVARDCDAEWIRDTLAEVDFERRVVYTGEDRELPYDALLIAVGGRPASDIEGVLVFRDAEAGEIYERVAEDLEDGHASSVAFIVSEGPTYALPVYELALMTAERARTSVEGLELYLVTPEPSPLAVLGGSAGATVTGKLLQAGVRLYLSATAFVPAPARLLVQPQGVELAPDRIVVIPRVTGPGIRGVPAAGPHGFIPVDRHCAVPGGGGRVFAAGDATAYPIKHGGLGAQQADVAAAAIARLGGAEAPVTVFRPEIRAKLLTGHEPLYLRCGPAGGDGFESEVFDSPPWPAGDKVVAEELGPYLARLDKS